MDGEGIRMIQADYNVDAKGVACPLPIVRTRKAVKEMEPGTVVEVETTDKGSTADLKAWAKSAGHEYIGTIEENDVLKHYLRKADEGNKEEEKFPHVVSNEQFEYILESNKDFVLLDVREEVEYAFGHIPSAQSMPLSTVEEQFNKIDKNSEVYIICRSGNRSDTVAKQLSAAGFEKVFNVVPGMSNWTGTVEKTNREA